jgi:hypothetical protein
MARCKQVEGVDGERQNCYADGEKQRWGKERVGGRDSHVELGEALSECDLVHRSVAQLLKRLPNLPPSSSII